MTDYSKAKIFSSASSNKVIKEESGSFAVPALGGIGDTYGIATIPHGHTSDELIFQVSGTTTVAGTGGMVAMPWRSPDGRIFQYAYIDDTNIYIVCVSSSSSPSGASARTVNYYYRLLIP